MSHEQAKTKQHWKVWASLYKWYYGKGKPEGEVIGLPIHSERNTNLSSETFSLTSRDAFIDLKV